MDGQRSLALPHAGFKRNDEHGAAQRYLADLAAMCARAALSTDSRELTTVLGVLARQYQVAPWVAPRLGRAA